VAHGGAAGAEADAEGGEGRNWEEGEMNPLREIAELAYAAYGQIVGWKNVVGNPMPKWEDSAEGIQRAREAACVAAHGAAMSRGL
jgi:hypothetical protein